MVSKISELNCQDIYFAKLKSLPNFIITEGSYESLSLRRPGFSESGMARGIHSLCNFPS